MSYQMNVGFNVGASLSDKLHSEVVERLIVRLQRSHQDDDYIILVNYSHIKSRAALELSSISFKPGSLPSALVSPVNPHAR